MEQESRMMEPCPFCGGNGEEWEEEGGYPWISNRKIGCRKCGIGFHNNHGEGIERWNRRA